MIIFIIASGLTLVFGLMDVLNFGHGVFIALGAFVATSVMGGMADWTASAVAVPQPGGGVLPRCWSRWSSPARSGWAFERVIVRPVYGHAPEADPDHDGRHDRRRGADQGHLGPGADPAAAARGAARRVPARRCGGREVPRAGGRRSARVVFVAMLCTLEPHQGRPADPRRRAGPRDGRGARLPHPAPVRRRVRRRLARWPASAACCGACTSRT